MAGELTTTFNWERCTELHNQIFDIGWESTTASRRLAPTWWETWTQLPQTYYTSNMQQGLSVEQALEQLYRRLPSDVVRFLKVAKCSKAAYGLWYNINFFHGVHGLGDPLQMVDWLDGDPQWGWLYGTHTRPRDIIPLYDANQEYSHRLGILSVYGDACFERLYTDHMIDSIFVK
jgi:hypothetical protein